MHGRIWLESEQIREVRFIFQSLIPADFSTQAEESSSQDTNAANIEKSNCMRGDENDFASLIAQIKKHLEIRYLYEFAESEMKPGK